MFYVTNKKVHFKRIIPNLLQVLRGRTDHTSTHQIRHKWALQTREVGATACCDVITIHPSTEEFSRMTLLQYDKRNIDKSGQKMRSKN